MESTLGHGADVYRNLQAVHCLCDKAVLFGTDESCGINMQTGVVFRMRIK